MSILISVFDCNRGTSKMRLYARWAIKICPKKKGRACFIYHLLYHELIAIENSNRSFIRSVEKRQTYRITLKLRKHRNVIVVVSSCAKELPWYYTLARNTGEIETILWDERLAKSAGHVWIPAHKVYSAFYGTERRSNTEV
jgi:hypothetical protein